MMNDASLKVIRKLKDSQGRPIFLPGYDGLAGSMPATLRGAPGFWAAATVGLVLAGAARSAFMLRMMRNERLALL